MTKAIQPRSVAVCIAHTSSTPPLICLVSSRKHESRWVLPKGGIESYDSGGEAAAAVRELWEEAGVKASPPPSGGQHDNDWDSVIADVKPHKHSPSKDPHSPAFVPRAIYTAVAVQVDAETDVRDEWPEAHERKREFVHVEEALRRIEWRGDIHELLGRWWERERKKGQASA